jgi:hypothetical protein
MFLRKAFKDADQPVTSRFKVAVLGCQRSGTTLLREILNTGQILMFEENWVWSYFCRERWHAGGVWHSDPTTDSNEQIIWDNAVRIFATQTYEKYFDLKREDCHKYWGVKAPGLNMAKTARYLEKIFPDLRFVIVVRDPRDTLVSMRASPKMMGNLPDDFYGSSINSPDLVEIFFTPHGYWGRVYATLGQMVESVGSKCHTIRYEEMLDKPVDTIRGVCAFLGVQFATAMIEPFTRKISNASVISMAHEDYLAGHFRVSQRAAGRWKKELSRADYEKLVYESGKVAKAWGYDIV